MTAVLQHLAPGVRVVGIDHIQELVDWSVDNLKKDGISVGKGGVEIVCGDGRLGEFVRIDGDADFRIPRAWSVTSNSCLATLKS